eukprot:scaffold64816_cov25-Prasinocladus_malaysianus.AAC.1
MANDNVAQNCALGNLSSCILLYQGYCVGISKAIHKWALAGVNVTCELRQLCRLVATLLVACWLPGSSGPTDASRRSKWRAISHLTVPCHHYA